MYELFLEALAKIAPCLLYFILAVLLILVWKPLKVFIKDTAASRLGKIAYTYAETVWKDEVSEIKLEKAIKYFNQHKDSWGLGKLSMESIRAAIEEAWNEYN